MGYFEVRTPSPDGGQKHFIVRDIGLAAYLWHLKFYYIDIGHEGSMRFYFVFENSAAIQDATNDFAQGKTVVPPREYYEAVRFFVRQIKQAKRNIVSYPAS